MSTSERRIERLRELVTELRSYADDGPSPDEVVRVTRALHPHLYDGSFAENLAKLRLFTDVQATEAAERKREEHELSTEHLLLHYLNEDLS